MWAGQELGMMEPRAPERDGTYEIYGDLCFHVSLVPLVS